MVLFKAYALIILSLWDNLYLSVIIFNQYINLFFSLYVNMYALSYKLNAVCNYISYEDIFNTNRMPLFPLINYSR